MSDPLTLNQRFVLASRPVGAPTPENFRLEREALPDLQDGQVLLKTLYLSLDPYMRGRMSDAPSYAAPVQIGEVMTGGAVSRVESSRHPKFHQGDLVVGLTGGIATGKSTVAAMFAVMLSSVALFLMIVEGRAAAIVLMPAEDARALSSSCNRSTRRCTLPVVVIGSASMNSISFGYS